jgi:hypothetical protein
VQTELPLNKGEGESFAVNPNCDSGNTEPLIWDEPKSKASRLNV